MVCFYQTDNWISCLTIRRDLTEKKAEAAKQTAKRDKVKNKDRGIEL